MISISTIDADAAGAVIFKEDQKSKFRSTPARVTKSKTLDGDVVIDHRGFVDVDRDFEIIATLDEDQVDALWYIYTTYTFVNLSCKEGFYQGAMNLEIVNDKLTLNFLAKEKKNV